MNFFNKNPILPINSQISTSAVLDGNLTSNDNIKIDGRVLGSVSTRGDIVIADTGYVERDLHGNNIYIEGKIKGNVIARGKLVLGATADIYGEIKSKTLATEEGARFNKKAEMIKKQKTETPVETNSVFQAKITAKTKVQKSGNNSIEKPDISNINIRNVRTSSHMNPLPKSDQLKNEEEEKKAFLKTFYFDPDE